MTQLLIPQHVSYIKSLGEVCSELRMAINPYDTPPEQK